MNEYTIQAADLVVGDIMVDEAGRRILVESITVARDYLVTTNSGQANEMRGFVWEHVTVLRPS